MLRYAESFRYPPSIYWLLAQVFQGLNDLKGIIRSVYSEYGVHQSLSLA